MNAANNNIRATIFKKHTHRIPRYSAKSAKVCILGFLEKNVHSHYKDFHVPNENSIRSNEKKYMKDSGVYNQTHWFIWSHFIKRKKAKIRNVLRN